MKNKVLIVAYYWPPAGGPGVQRWLKFAIHLPEHGIEPVLFVPDNPAYPIIDNELVAQVPHDLKVYRGPIWEPYRMAGFLSKKTKKISSGIIPPLKKAGVLEKLAIWIRGNLFIPDARVFWVGPSVSRIGRILIDEGIDTVITTGPPHSVHLIGLELQKRHKIKWIADFRDPWTTIGYHSSLMLTPFAQRRHKQLEHAVLSSASRVIATSPSTAAEFRNIGAKNVTVITNGFEPVEMDVKLDSKFTVAHIGSLLAGRNPVNLWQALAEMMAEVPGFKHDFLLELTGTVSQEVAESIAAAGLSSHLTISPYLPHQEAVRRQRSAQVLLLIEIDSPETRAILPGKLFEYMASGRPILAVGPEGSDIEAIIRETRSGAFFNHLQKEEIKQFIGTLYQDFKNGSLKSDAIGTQPYTRRETSRKLAQLIRGLWE